MIGPFSWSIASAHHGGREVDVASHGNHTEQNAVFHEPHKPAAKREDPNNCGTSYNGKSQYH